MSRVRSFGPSSRRLAQGLVDAALLPAPAFATGHLWPPCMSVPPLWTTDAMVAAMGAGRPGALPAGVPGLSIDSRTVAPGEAFFAITGENRDGHDFVEAALEAGAGLAVVDAGKQQRFPAGAPLLLVSDVLEALRDLARAARARSQAKIVAVTGSVGKTGTKEALHLALSKQGQTHASAASYNNHWGVPLSLARCPASAVYSVFELGMNHAGEIAPLARLVRPHVAIITAVEPVHLEFFDSVAAIADAKAEIFIGLERGGRPSSIGTMLNTSDLQGAPAAPALSGLSRSARIPKLMRGSPRARCRARTPSWRHKSSGPICAIASAHPGATSCSIRWPCSLRPRCSGPT